jgi:FAD/FMN-containing dehydrogenase
MCPVKNDLFPSASLTTFYILFIGGITIGGAIGTAAHGSSLLHPTSLSEQAISMTIIDGHGSLRVISDPKDLNAFRVHLGLLGILVNVTFATVPAFKMTIFNKAYSESLLTDGTALAWAHFFNLYQIWWFPSKKDIVVSKGLYHPPGSGLTSLPKEEDFVNFVPPIESQTVAYLTELLEQLQRKNDINALYSIENGTENGLVTTVYGRPPFFEDPYGFYENPATGLGWHMMSNR